MSYQRVEINLLPPELQPGPAVRYALLINFAIIAVLVAFLMISSFFSLSKIAGLRDTNNQLDQQLENMQDTKERYQNLDKIREAINSYGKMIAFASTDYVEMPLIMERISRVVPTGVHVEAITNRGQVAGTDGSVLSVAMRTAEPNTALVNETVNAFKNDPILGNCFLRNTQKDQGDLDDLLANIGADWTFAGPGYEPNVTYDNYGFEIASLIVSPVDISGTRIEADLRDTVLKEDPPLVLNGNGSGDSTSDSGERTSEAIDGVDPDEEIPPGVTVVEGE